jgi:mono/diheme cytochrome c family protein
VFDGRRRVARRLSRAGLPNFLGITCFLAVAIVIAAAIFFASAIFFPVVWAAEQPGEDSLARGKYLFNAGGCTSCHTDVKGGGPVLGGGRALKTPFGVFYGPNITADPVHGIGTWSDEDFIRALRDGVGPDGEQFFPVFPYTSFTNITDADLKDLKAYIFSLPTAATPDLAHEIKFPFGFRFLVRFWKWLYFKRGPFEPDPDKSAQWNRGAYLVRALGHCGECHTPRGLLGGPRRNMELAGTAEGPEGGAIPNITPDPETGIGKWSAGEIADLLSSGLTPEGDIVGGAMAEVTETVTGKLTPDDIQAIVVYLRALPPIKNRITRKK